MLQKYSALLALLLVSSLSRANDPIVSIPFTIEHGHIYIQILINDKDTLHVAFDTGARANLLDKKIANRMDVRVTGSQQVQGVSGFQRMDQSRGNTIRIGDLKLSSQIFLLMDLDHLGDEDSPMDGVIGGGILDRYVVEIDYDNELIKIFETRGYVPPSNYQRQEISLSPFGIPVVKASIFSPNGDTVTGRFLVDTGAALAFSLNTPFVRKHRLKQTMGKSYEYSYRAVGPRDATDIVRLQKANIFGQNISNMTARLASTNTGVSGTNQVSGIVGLEVLKRFNTIYDYRNGVMYLSPSKWLNRPFHFNHSGLKVKKENGRLTIEEVYPNSPAQKAGIKTNDLIESIDGTKSLTQDEFHRYFQNTNREVRITLLRNGQKMEVKLHPMAMI